MVYHQGISMQAIYKLTAVYLDIIPTSTSLGKKSMPHGKNTETIPCLKGINCYRLGILNNILKPLRGWVAITSLFKEEH